MTSKWLTKWLTFYLFLHLLFMLNFGAKFLDSFFKGFCEYLGVFLTFSLSVPLITLSHSICCTVFLKLSCLPLGIPINSFSVRYGWKRFFVSFLPTKVIMLNNVKILSGLLVKIWSIWVLVELGILFFLTIDHLRQVKFICHTFEPLSGWIILPVDVEVSHDNNLLLHLHSFNSVSRFW